MKSQKVFVVQELIGDWEDPEIASLLGCYTSLESAETAVTEHVKVISDEVKSQICGYEIAFMTLIDEGFREVYCSIYQDARKAPSYQGGDGQRAFCWNPVFV